MGIRDIEREDYWRPPFRVFSGGFRVWRWEFLLRCRWTRGLAFGAEWGGRRFRGASRASPGLHLMFGVVVVTLEHATTFIPVGERG